MAPPRTGRRQRRGVLLATTLALALVAQGCAVRGLSFVQDDRVSIEYPDTNETVRLPLELRWTAEGFDGKFALFFDRSPIRPGQSLLAVVPEADACRAQPTCPDDRWLNDHYIYVTEDTRVTVEHLPDRRENSRAKDRHDVTIVLLDDEGRRTGESAFTREFIVDRERS